jgi:hypothetical protein
MTLHERLLVLYLSRLVLDSRHVFALAYCLAFLKFFTYVCMLGRLHRHSRFT